MTQSLHDSIRSYRICLRDGSNALANSHDVNLPSDEEANQMATLLLDGQVSYRCAEVWDRMRLVCTVRREESVLAD